MARRIIERNLQNSTLQNIYVILQAQVNAWHKFILTTVFIILAPVLIFAARKPLLFVKTIRTQDSNIPLYPLSGRLDYIEETQVVWQVPSASLLVTPKAILFLAHGCNGRAAFFWDKSTDCAECLGLPEERVIVMHALAKGYAVIAISSTRECWSISSDKAKVMSILSFWIKDKGLEGLPIVALGASSGGFFVSALARDYKFEAIVIMISEGLFHKMKIGRNYPPTLFVHMVKDKRRASLIRNAIDMLRSKGIDTNEIKCYPLIITPEYFTKIPGLDSMTSHRIYKVFKETGVIGHDNLMRLDGRAMNWMMPLKERQVMPDNYYKLWDMHVQELLNLAYGFHEMTSIQSNEIFEWLGSQMLKQGV